MNTFAKNKIQRMKIVRICTILGSLFTMLFFAGCRNIFDPHHAHEGDPGTGLVSVTIGDQGDQRTIMPTYGLSSFTRFDLTFTPNAGLGNLNDDIEETMVQNETFKVVALPVGHWNLTIIAYLGDTPVASGSSATFEVNSMGPTPISVPLAPFAEGEGTFRWNINFTGFTNPLDLVEMDIHDYDDNHIEGSPVIFIEDGGTPVRASSSIEDIEAGEYRVNIRMQRGDLEVTISQVLHIYPGMTSTLNATYNANTVFTRALVDLVADRWNGTTWNFTGITAAHFTHMGILGVTDLAALTTHFNTLCAADGAPHDVGGFKTLVDAALIKAALSDASGTTLLGGTYVDSGAADEAIVNFVDDTAQNGSEVLGAKSWIAGTGTTTAVVEIGDYEITFAFTTNIALQPVLTGSVVINGDILVGSTLTAVPNITSGATGEITYLWYHTGSGEALTATDDTYPVQFSDVGKGIRVVVATANNSGTIGNIGYTANVPEPTITIENRLTSNLSTVVAGTPLARRHTMRATIDPLTLHSDLISAAQYQWRHGPYGDSDALASSPTPSDHPLTNPDAGKTLRVYVTFGSFVLPADGFHSASTATVAYPPFTGNITISQADDKPWVGNSLTAATGGGFTEDGQTVTYHWERSTSSAFSDVERDSGATTLTPHVIASDSTHPFIRVSASSPTFAGTLHSDNLMEVPPVVPTINGEHTAVAIGAIHPIVGTALTAVFENLGGTPTFQWYRDSTAIGSPASGTAVSEGFSTSYTPAAIDRTPTAQQLHVRAIVNGVDFESPLTGTVRWPAISGTVTISGIPPRVGYTLTADISALEGGTPSYQWQRSAIGSPDNYTDIGGATGDTYSPVDGDVGRYIRVEVTRAEREGPAHADTVSAVALPSADGTISIGGTLHVGETLTATIVDLPGSGTLQYKWEVGAAPRPDEVDDTYVIRQTDVGQNITLTMTRLGYSGSATSTVGPVVPPTVTINNMTPKVGDVLMATIQNLGGTGTDTYKWTYGDDIETPTSANDSSYTVRQADEGKTIKVWVTRAGVYENLHTETAAVLVPDVTISNTSPRIGNTLMATIQNLGGTGTDTFTWYSADTEVQSSSSNTYIVKQGDENKTIKVRVDRAGVFVDLYSAATAVVPVPTLTLTKNSNPYAAPVHYKDILTATVNNVFGIDEDNDIQWLHGDGQTTVGKTYTVVPDDIGETITVKVNRTGLYVGLDITTSVVLALPITVAMIDVTAPEADKLPILVATITTETPEESFTVGNVEWSRDDGAWDESLDFESGNEYTASVILTAKPGYIFTSETNASIGGSGSKEITDAGRTLTLERKFLLD